MKTLDDLFKGITFSKEQDEKTARILFPYVTVKEIVIPRELFYIRGYYPFFMFETIPVGNVLTIYEIYIYQAFFLGDGKLLIHRALNVYDPFFKKRKKDEFAYVTYTSFKKNIYKINKEALAKLAIMQADIGLELKTEEEIVGMAEEWKKAYNAVRS